MRLAIVIGHEKKSPGADSVAPLRLTEYDYNTEVAQIMYREAMERGLQTKIFTRDGVGISGAYKQVNEWCKDDGDAVCIELHFNASNGKVKGTETLFDNEPSASIDFAREIQSIVCAVFKRQGKEDRKLKPLIEGDRGYPNEKACKVVACIIEPFFGDNKDDAQMAMELQTDYAEALVQGVFDYFEARDAKMAMN